MIASRRFLPTASPAPNRIARHSLGLLVLAAAFAFLSTSDAEARTLRHRATKFSAKAPSGYTLRAFKGIYTIRKGSDSATIMRVSSPLDSAGLARSLVTAGRLKKARVRGGGSRRTVTGLAAGKPVYIEIEGRGPTFKVSKYVTRKKSPRSKTARRFEELTARDVAILRRIAGSARGGIVSPFQANIPVRRFTQGGASAVVPVLPGWTFSGVGGAIDGGRVGQGSFALGIYMPSVAGFVDPGAVIVNNWSQVTGAPITVTNIQIIPGTAGVLGFGFNSATYTLRFVTGGVSYDAIMTSGVTNNPAGFGLDWYFSYVAVRTGAFPGLGQTLMQAWATWDASANRQSRTAATVAAIRSTPTVAIDREVFDRINSAWVEYIRR
jgi:hypothetical protein